MTLLSMQIFFCHLCLIHIAAVLFSYSQLFASYSLGTNRYRLLDTTSVIISLASAVHNYVSEVGV